MRWINIVLGLLVTLMGILPFLESILPVEWKVIPSSGNGYSLIILVLGVLIIINAYGYRRRHRLLGLK